MGLVPHLMYYTNIKMIMAHAATRVDIAANVKPEVK